MPKVTYNQNEDGSFDVSQVGFHYFVASCRYFLEFFRVGDWEIRYRMYDGDGESPRAMFSTDDYSNRLGCISLYTPWDLPPNPIELSRTAMHEVWECVLADYFIVAASRDYDPLDHDRIHHSLIRRMEAVVFPLISSDKERLKRIDEYFVDIRKRSSEGSGLSEIYREAMLSDSKLRSNNRKRGRGSNRLSSHEKHGVGRNGDKAV